MACLVEHVRVILYDIRDIADVITTDVSLINPLLASLANNVSEVGCVSHSRCFLFLLRSIFLTFLAQLQHSAWSMLHHHRICQPGWNTYVRRTSYSESDMGTTTRLFRCMHVHQLRFSVCRKTLDSKEQADLESLKV